MKKTKIVIFGGSGFLGKYLCQELLKNKKYLLINYDLKKTYFKSKNYTFVKGNILDEKKIVSVLKKTDFVFNLASVSDIEECLDKPIKSAEINILGNLNILNACVKNKIKKIFYASSLYAFSDQGGFYKCSKQASEQYILEYQKLHNLNYIILRYGSVYGINCSKENGIYRILKNIIVDKKLIYNGNKKSERSYVHATDVAKMTIEIMQGKSKNCVFVLKGKKKIKIIDFLKKIKNILSLDYKIEFGKDKMYAHYVKEPKKIKLSVSKNFKYHNKENLDIELIRMYRFMREKYEKYRII